ncbi:hypothetical protein DL240_05830 [Lujinxingia litoralis]|uniref:LNS2/PITP domain-containing protein n=2 Tax=Lujinxingia litoralis TaxID=2211119 RepID=A0A328C9R0_9DELT|nr:hypothetical protein DL240_05830 [Lujinxingia litoralis]
MLGACGPSEASQAPWNDDVGNEDVGEPDGKGDHVGDGGSNDAGEGDVDPGASLPVHVFCDQAPLPQFGEDDTVDWENFSSRAIAALSDWHSAQDVITHPAREAVLTGKFTYGPTSKDLQGERIEVWMDDCSGEYVRVGEGLTDSDGRVALTMAPDVLPPVGAYALYLRVMGDNTYTRSMMRVLPQGTKLLVFDIDATLTTSDTELFADIFNDLFEPIFDGDYVPEARAGATDITQVRHGEHGYQLVYMTGRPYWLTAQSREWLIDQGMAPGHLRLTSSNSESMPTEGGVGTYKAEFLAYLQGLGFEVTVAYGNATTDIYAYAQAGVPLDRTYILGAHGGEEGTVALGEDYLTHLQDIQGEVAVEQPFTWGP